MWIAALAERLNGTIIDMAWSAAVSKRISLILRWSVLTIIVTSLLCLAPLLDDGFRYDLWVNAALVAGVAVLGGLLSAAILYLGYVARSLRSLRVAQEELGVTEKVLKQTRGSIVHYRNGSPWRFWEAVGGKLFLTSSRLIFRVHAGQPWRYEVVIPLAEVIGVSRCSMPGLATALVVRCADVADELFGVGVLESADEWVSAISVLRGLGPMVEGRSADRAPRRERTGIQEAPGIMAEGLAGPE
jgi:hypothetical protein